jgi:hypothetical protein
MSQTKRPLRRLTVSVLLGALSLSACASPEPTPTAHSPAQGLADAPDGNVTISAVNTVVNSYAQLMVDAPVNATTITVVPAQLAAMGLKAFDLVMLYQAQGALVGTTDDETYGSITNPSGAGRFELLGVTAVNSATGVITLDSLCSGLKNAYSAAGNSQVIRVPQYADLTVSAPGSIVPTAWNGSTGGVVALRARHVTVAANAAISASGKGCRGGAAVKAGSQAADTTTYISTLSSAGAGGGKGEGIAVQFANLFARGANSSGGGGGNAFGSGGGGGGNGGVLATWKGNGVMNLHAAADAMSWALDPAYSANTRTNEDGGGRGGYTQALATADQNATMIGPDSAA